MSGVVPSWKRCNPVFGYEYKSGIFNSLEFTVVKYQQLFQHISNCTPHCVDIHLGMSSEVLQIPSLSRSRLSTARRTFPRLVHHIRRTVVVVYDMVDLNGSPLTGPSGGTFNSFYDAMQPMSETNVWLALVGQAISERSSRPNKRRRD